MYRQWDKKDEDESQGAMGKRSPSCETRNGRSCERRKVGAEG